MLNGTLSDDSLWHWVRTLRGRQFPRNRHFTEHSSPVMTRARAMLRYLRSVESDIVAAESITMRKKGDAMELELHFPTVRFRRVVQLDKEQLEMLLEHEPCARRLFGTPRVSHETNVEQP